MKEIKLQSGALLKISHTPFSESKALYQAVLEEMKSIKLATGAELGDLIKDIFCIGFSSKKVEAALDVCFKRCTYSNGNGDLKIDDKTFESESAREDYSMVCIEVIQENISPFMKGLFAGFKRVSAMMPSDLQ